MKCRWKHPPSIFAKCDLDLLMITMTDPFGIIFQLLLPPQLLLLISFLLLLDYSYYCCCYFRTLSGTFMRHCHVAEWLLFQFGRGLPVNRPAGRVRVAYAAKLCVFNCWCYRTADNGATPVDC